MDKLASSSAAAPSESFRLSMQNDQQGGTNNHQQFQRNLVSEPLYENVRQQQFSNDHLNSSPENRLSTHQGHSVEQPKVTLNARLTFWPPNHEGEGGVKINEEGAEFCRLYSEVFFSGLG